MLIISTLEVELYPMKSVELRRLLKDKLPGIQSVYQPESGYVIQKLFSHYRKSRLCLIPRGAATLWIGCIIPLRKSIRDDLASLNRIMDFDLST